MSSLPKIPGYCVHTRLGVGGMGVVFMATRPDNNYKYAIKMLLVGRAASVEELLRFRIEAEAYACLNHPNIIKIRDVGVVAGCPFLAMDFAENGSLANYLKKFPNLNTNWRVNTIKKVAEALAHAHGRRILHRDLKPSNILIAADGTPRVSDFGLVKFSAPMADINQACCTLEVSILDEHLVLLANENKRLLPVAGNGRLLETLVCQCAERSGLSQDRFDLDTIQYFVQQTKEVAASSNELFPLLDHMTQFGAVLGSPQFMAPEQALGRISDIGPHTDVYGLGATLYCALTGHAPIMGKDAYEVIRNVPVMAIRPPEQLNPDINADLSAVVQKAMEKNIDRRYDSMEHFAEDLGRILNGSTPVATHSQKSKTQRSMLRVAMDSFSRLIGHAKKRKPDQIDDSTNLSRTEKFETK